MTRVRSRKSNSYRVSGDSTVITTTNGRSVLIDTNDATKARERIWYATRCGQIWYALSTTRPQVLLHKLLMGDGEIDHRNGDGLDNRRSNLRVVTRQENSRNRLVCRGASRFKGVSWRTDRRSWVAQIGVNGRRIWLGRFQTEEEAALAYDAAARSLFGEHAALNFAGTGERSCLREAGK